MSWLSLSGFLKTQLSLVDCLQLEDGVLIILEFKWIRGSAFFIRRIRSSGFTSNGAVCYDAIMMRHEYLQVNDGTCVHYYT